LATVQAFLLRELLFPADPDLLPTDPATCPLRRRNEALATALTTVLWRVRAGLVSDDAANSVMPHLNGC